MDMIGKIHPASSKGHEWILAITDYFTKWVEAVPMKKVKSEDVIKFVKEHVIHRFGIPQTITTDGGSVFISKEFRKFCGLWTRRVDQRRKSGAPNRRKPMMRHRLAQTWCSSFRRSLVLQD